MVDPMHRDKLFHFLKHFQVEYNLCMYVRVCVCVCVLCDKGKVRYSVLCLVFNHWYLDVSDVLL